jgi:hypothetical protein
MASLINVFWQININDTTQMDESQKEFSILLFYHHHIGNIANNE